MHMEIKETPPFPAEESISFHRVETTPGGADVGHVACAIEVTEDDPCVASGDLYSLVLR